MNKISLILAVGIVVAITGWLVCHVVNLSGYE